MQCAYFFLIDVQAVRKKKIMPDYLCAKVIMRTPTVNKAKIEKLKFKLLLVHSDQSNGQRIYVTESCQVKTFSVF